MALRVTRLFSQVAVAPSGAFVENVTHAIFAAGSTIAIADIFNESVNHAIFDDPSDNLWVYDPVYNVFVGHTLFGAGETVEPYYWEIAHSLFSTSQASLDEYREVIHYLGFTERTFETINHALFRNAEPVVVSEATIVNAANYLFTNPSQNNKVVHAHNISNSLGWGSIVVQTFDNDIVERLGLSGALDISSNSYGRAVTQGGFLRQSISLTIGTSDPKCQEETFSPLIGVSDDETFDDMLITQPTLTEGDTLTLTYPYDSPTLTLVLQNPDFGNTDTFSFTRIDRKTRGGDSKQFSDPKWAKWERLELSVEGIDPCVTTLQEIADFLNASLGKNIGFADWEGRKWRGVIIAPDTTLGEKQIGLAVKIAFEGELTTLEVQYGTDDVIHGQDTDGIDIDVTYEE
jgi:hypothetical protein